jgi:hypothetical protein
MKPSKSVGWCPQMSWGPIGETILPVLSRLSDGVFPVSELPEPWQRIYGRNFPNARATIRFYWQEGEIDFKGRSIPGTKGNGQWWAEITTVDTGEPKALG